MVELSSNCCYLCYSIMHLIKLTIKAVPKLRPKFIDKMFDFYQVNQSDTFMLRHMLFKDLFHNASASML